jgi:hypothetical protein
MHYLIHNVIMNELAISSFCWPLHLPHHVPNRFLFVLHHVSSIFARFQLIFPLTNMQAWPCLGLPLSSLQTGSRKSWIQAIAHLSVGHRYDEDVVLSIIMLYNKLKIGVCKKNQLLIIDVENNADT